MQTVKKILLIFIFYAIPKQGMLAQERTLAYYITMASQNSPLLKDYSNQKVVNLIDSLRILAGYKPQVNGVSNNSYSPIIKGWGYDEAITNGANFSQLVTISKNLVRKELVQNQLEAVQLLNESLSISGKITEQDLTKSITAQYITAYGSWQQVTYNSELLLLLKKDEAILKNLTEKGIYRQTDYLSFLVNLQQQEILISQITIQYQNDIQTLHYLAGISDATFPILENPIIEIANIPEVENTAFYQQYRIDSLRLKNNDALIDYNYKPKINAYADGGYVTAFPSDFYKNFGLSVGLNVSVPIYDGKQKKMQHDKIGIAERTRQNYRDYFKKQFRQQSTQLFQQLQATVKLIEQMNGQMRYSKALIEANRKLLETGDVRMAEFLQAITNYQNAQNSIKLYTINKLQIINQINYWNLK